MRICLYETSHHETALAMLLLLDRESAKLTVFTTMAVEAHLRASLGDQAKDIQWMTRGDEESSRHFIKRMDVFCRAHHQDVLLLETVEANHYPIARMIAGLPRTRVLLTIHDVHTNFLSRMRPSLRGIVRHLGKKALLAHASGFIALSSNVSAHLTKFMTDGRPVIWVPGSVFQPESFVPLALPPEGPLRLVVPGSYDKRRRDYERLFRLASEWEDLGIDIHIDLLGGQGPDTEEVLARCMSWTGRHVSITSYASGEVPEPVFTRHMQAAHFIWVPSVVRTTIADGIEEIYGLSKSSGNTFDAIRYARPLIIPADLQVDDLQAPACFRYESGEDLKSFFKSLLKAPEGYEDLLQKALTVSRSYTVDGIRERTPQLGYLFNPA